MSTLDPSQQAFECAKDAFRNGLKDEKLFKDLLAAPNVESVWQEVKKLQAKQDSEKRLRRLGKIKSFIEKLTAYATTVDTFVQVKPDIMALVWGPIRLLLVWTDNIAKFADAIVAAMVKIGDALPQFVEIAQIFSDNDKRKEVLALFYKDILEFYDIALKFFNLSTAKLVFESIWPRQMARIEKVAGHIERHSNLLRDQVTLQHIREEFEFREKSLAHFDQEADFQDSQKFRALKTYISPMVYDDVLDRFLNRSCTGSASWLFDHDSFTNWLDISNRAAKLLWLAGIPGAGKTFLCAAVIHEAKSRQRTLFAFATYLHRSTATAKSVLQSMLFQLTADSKDLQSVLVNSSEHNLNSTTYVSGLLKKLLDGAGPTYIILDGLDEMEAEQRGILLNQLSTLEECHEVKILVSSRPEDDIATVLETKAVCIRVDKNNSGSIRSYVGKRFEDWMDMTDFDREARKNIQQLLMPVAPNSNGMFLYARIVLDNVVEFNDLEEIERELRALPADLNDAYHRIFSRINSLQPAALRRKARLILGWMGCAPVPMTRYEIEQALSVQTDFKTAPSVIASLAFNRICGPIIEVAEESLQFVHFTAKEYISSQQIKDFIDLAEANYTLSKCCLAYLCSGIFDGDLTDKQLRENMLAGKYRLHWFASRQWVATTRRCIEKSKDLSAYPDLLELLVRFALELRNDEFDGQVDMKNDLFPSIGTDLPEISSIMCGILQFYRDERQTEWSYSGSYWVKFDPSIMSRAAVRIHECFEALVCDEKGHGKSTCHCAKLQRHYGTRMFKCPFPSCGHNRQGFHTRKTRDSHVRYHNRPWKCSFSGCLYVITGFETIRGMYDHMQKMHPAPPLPGTLSLNKPSFYDLQVLLFELTKAGDIGRLQQAVLYLGRNDRPALAATILAVKMGSLQMAEILTRMSEDTRDYQLWTMDTVAMYQAVARSDNLEIFRWFLGHMCRVERIHSYATLTSEILANSSPDIYAEWENFLLDPAQRLKHGCRHGLETNEPPRNDYWAGKFREASSLIPHYNKRSAMFSQSAFKAVKNNAFLEARLVQTWHRLIDSLGGASLNPSFLGWSLTQLGKSLNCSISLATELLRLGAPIDFPRGAGSRIDNTMFETPVPQLGKSAQSGSKGSETVTSQSAVSNRLNANDGSGAGIDQFSRRRKRHRKKYRGMTALHFVARSTSEKAAQFIRFLLEEGADPEYGWSGKKPVQEKAAPLMQKWLGETWEELVERTKHKRRQDRRREALEHGEDETNETDDSDDSDDSDASDDREEESAEDAPKGNRRQGTAKRRKHNSASNEDE